MRPRCNSRQSRLSMRVVLLLKLVVLAGLMLSSVGCSLIDALPEHYGAFYPDNCGPSGQFFVTGTKGSGTAYLPASMVYPDSSGDPDKAHREPFTGWSYRYKWVGADGKTHVSDWKDLGMRPDGKISLTLNVRPSEVPELGDSWDRCICETRGTYKLSDGEYATQYIPIPVWVAPASGAP